MSGRLGHRLEPWPPGGIHPFVFVGTQCLDYRLGIGINPLRLEQHPTAEFQLLYCAGSREQAHHGLQFLVLELDAFARQPQSQIIPQFIEPQQHATLVFQPNNLLFELLEKQR